VLPALAARLETARAEIGVLRTQLDTYEREVERYGGALGIELFERFSHLDSEAALSISEELTGDDAGEARWQLSLRSMDQLLADAGLDVHARLELMKKVATGFRNEFGVRTAKER